MATTEIKIGGFGGQGVILSAIIVGKAASIFDNRHATLTQSFGPEARGGACSAQLIVSDEPVLYPYVTHPDVMVLMSQEAYTKYRPELREGGLLLLEEDLVQADAADCARIYRVPATRLAEEMGRRMILNVVMVGFLTAISEVVSAQGARKAIESTVPARTIELNINAFETGYEYGKKLLGGASQASSQLH